MRGGQGRRQKLAMSRYRIATLVIVIGGHLGLWLLLMWPVAAWRASVQDDGGTASVLELRFIRAPRSLRPRPLTKSPLLPAHTGFNRGGPPGRRRSQRVAGAAPAGRPYPKGTRHASGSIVIRIPDLDAVGEAAGNDGGFMERLHAAQRESRVHGVPGSDTVYAPGIHLIDPMDQGIGAVVRKVQRAFGITSSHCVDVDVWRHLTPKQLSERYISPSDVNRVSEKYHCNEPLGLHF